MPTSALRFVRPHQVSIQNLRREISSWATWAVSSAVYGAADTGTFDSVLKMFDNIRELCRSRVPPMFKKGDLVEVQFREQKDSALARVTRDNEDGTFNAKCVRFPNSAWDTKEEEVTVPDTDKGTSARAVKKPDTARVRGASSAIAKEGASSAIAKGGLDAEVSNIENPMIEMVSVSSASPAAARTDSTAPTAQDGHVAKHLHRYEKLSDGRQGKKLPLEYWQVIENHSHAAGEEDYSPVPKLKYVFQQQDLLLALSAEKVLFYTATIDFADIKDRGLTLANDIRAKPLAPGQTREQRETDAAKTRQHHRDGHDMMKHLAKEAFAAMRAIVFANRAGQLRFFHADIGR
jgi:hypothetical protein